MKEKDGRVGAEKEAKNSGVTQTTGIKKSLIDLLNEDKELQSQYDKKISDALRTAKANWEKERNISKNTKLNKHSSYKNKSKKESFSGTMIEIIMKDI